MNITSEKHYLSHVGTHLEQLALFVLPRLEYEDDEDQNEHEDSEVSHGTEEEDGSVSLTSNQEVNKLSVQSWQQSQLAEVSSDSPVPDATEAPTSDNLEEPYDLQESWIGDQSLPDNQGQVHAQMARHGPDAGQRNAGVAAELEEEQAELEVLRYKKAFNPRRFTAKDHERYRQIIKQRKERRRARYEEEERKQREEEEHIGRHGNDENDDSHTEVLPSTRPVTTGFADQEGSHRHDSDREYTGRGVPETQVPSPRVGFPMVGSPSNASESDPHLSPSHAPEPVLSEPIASSSRNKEDVLGTKPAQRDDGNDSTDPKPQVSHLEVESAEDGSAAEVTPRSDISPDSSGGITSPDVQSPDVPPTLDSKQEGEKANEDGSPEILLPHVCIHPGCNKRFETTASLHNHRLRHTVLGLWGGLQL